MKTAINLMSLPSTDDTNAYMAAIRQFPLLEQDEELFLTKKYQETGDENALYQIVTSHLRLVVKIANGFKGYGLPIGDVISEGNLGLIQATRKFKPEMGNRFSTYAIWWIRASIQEYILHSWSMVKIGTTSAQKKLFFNLRKIKNQLEISSETDIELESLAKISSEINVSEKEIVNMDRRLMNHDISLNNFRSNDNNDEWIDVIEDQKENQEIVLGKEEEKIAKRGLLVSALKNLSDREKYIIKERWLRRKATTLEKLSSKFNVSRERIRQIEEKAFKKMNIDITKTVSEMGLQF